MALKYTLGGALSVPSSTGLPGLSHLAAEAGNKIVNSGLTSNFNELTAVPGKIDNETNAAWEQSAQNTELIDLAAPAPAAPMDTQNKKVVIRQMPFVLKNEMPNELVFTVMPRIDERGGADYEAIQPIHHPGVIQKYRASTARSWGISGKLISRTVEEASWNLQIINMIRSWRMPFYGQQTSLDNKLNSYLGAPPPILELKAYGDTMIGPVNCVLRDYSWTFDNSLDYINTDTGIAFPVILEISLNLEEAWSPAEYSNFSLAEFKRGNLGGAYKAFVGTQSDFRRSEIEMQTTEEPVFDNEQLRQLARTEPTVIEKSNSMNIDNGNL